MSGRGPLLILGLITLIGAVLRLWNLDAAQYRADDHAVRTLALEIARDGKFPTGVLSSVGIANGPSAPFVLALPTLLSTEHQPLSVYVGLLNVAAIPVSYLLGRDLFGQRAGLLAAALIAVNPWLVAYGRRLWLNAFIGPAAVLFLWAFHRACVSSSLRAWALAGAAVSLSAQIHLSSLPNLAAFASVLAFASRGTTPSRRAVRPADSEPHGRAALPLHRIALGGLVALLLLGPWIVLSLQPDLNRFDWDTARTEAQEVGANSLERATIVMTGVAYQTVTGQGARIIDATAAPFVLIDVLARGLAIAGWLLLCTLVWREGRSNPALAATCLAMAIMVAIPIVALARPSQAGQLPYLYPYYFLNLIPPLVLGAVAFAETLSRLVRHLGTPLVILIAAAHLVLAIPYFLTQEEYWPLGGYGVPWKYTQAFVAEVNGLARPDRAPIIVGGHENDDNEQGNVAARLLGRDNDVVRLHDSRDGAVFRSGARPTVLVTTNDDHSMARLLRSAFAHRQAVEQVLPGAGWTRRAFVVDAQELEAWAAARLKRVEPAPSGQGAIVYERIGLAGSEAFGGQIVAIQWRMEADPAEPFFTDVVLHEAGREIHREPHVAYPAASWQRGDWLETRMLNLFRLPRAIQVTDATTVTLEHRGVLTGRPPAPPARAGPGLLSSL